MTKMELVEKAIDFAMSDLCDGYLDMPCSCEGCPLWSEDNMDDDGNVDCRGGILKEFIKQHKEEINDDDSKWIPTSEQMPPDEKFVIGYTPVNNNMFIGYHREDWRDPKGKWICLGPMGAPRIVTKKVTHWMWCPEMPEV